MLGVIQGHHATKLNEIKDGTSCTLLIGEKNLDPDDYYTGENWGDDQCWDTGWEWDVCRLACTQYQIANPLTDPVAYAFGYSSCGLMPDMLLQGGDIEGWGSCARDGRQHGIVRRLGASDKLFDGPGNAPPTQRHGRRAQDRRKKLASSTEFAVNFGSGSLPRA